MAPRPTWQGHLRLSLVTCPVALYTATNPGGEVRFNLLHPKTHNRIQMVATDPDLGPVERADLVKGYEVEKDRYVIVTPEEIESVRLESTRTIDIERFVDVADIDRLYWDNPYFLVPDGKLAVEAYSVIRDAMAGARRIALGRVVMHTRERLLAIEPRGKGLVAYSLRSFDEVRDPADLFDDIPAKKADPSMIAIARKIIEQQDGPFEPEDFKDRYEEALRDLIKRKEKGGKTKVTAAPVEDTNVVDLMEALRRSLGGKAPAAKTPAKKAAPKKAASARTKKAS
ncbi:Ku protein [Caulobacter radicis]|uniref:Non-homologous end joining protein Ku n=1 Tax=Caulobacter radicis TaxID=2172650 RepID=A0A2T9IWE6_9CAUL|nr:Ku protein [Caulobacter radicis]PVM71288.1 Ku protein [Caulobacter radicis]